MKLWVLFSIANEYDQPDNNLEGAWSKKPSFDELGKVIGIIVDKSLGHSGIGRLLKGQEVRIWNTYYRLREINEGKVGYIR